ncbi:zinc-binding dehydrogenase [Micromonospora sp. CA-263727]|uniref:zinc-binding dehydrogenase n=1 Tax=Micromonospora sp. CA-263727 TaxID=3239967 RepID=UPI003D94C151
MTERADRPTYRERHIDAKSVKEKKVQAVTIHGIRDIRVEEVPDPELRDPQDALVQVTHAAICGSDLWAYRGVSPREPGQRIGHEFIGVVTEIGRDVQHLRRGDLVIAPFMWSDGECRQCRAGWHTSCAQSGAWGQPGADGGQGEAVRVPFADATLVRVPATMDDAVLPALLTLADVLSTGHHGALASGVTPGDHVIVVGDGAVGLCGVLAARRLGAERVVLLGHHTERIEIARRFGAETYIGRSDSVVEEMRELTHGHGFDRVVEAVGTAQSLRTAISLAADGGTVGFVGVPHGGDGSVDLRQMFYRNVAVRGGVAPVRAYIPDLLSDVLTGELDAAAVFDHTIALDGVPRAYAKMEQREVLKALIRF